MYVCICNAYRDAEIREAALGGGPRCGRCLPTAQELIDREHDAPSALPVSVAEQSGARAG